MAIRPSYIMVVKNQGLGFRDLGFRNVGFRV